MDIVELHRPNPPLRFKKYRPVELALNLTTMIDVVFLLLIYFMVATDFSALERRFISDLPAEDQRTVSALSFELPVYIELRRNDKTLKTSILPERYEINPLPNEFEDVIKLKKYLKDNQYRFSASRPVFIKSDAFVYWEDTLNLYSVLLELGFKKITLKSLKG
tara:strand:+ start:35 stop:523 length:489 start_codon:yes stop_codon:yes gene_type:complete